MDLAHRMGPSPYNHIRKPTAHLFRYLNAYTTVPTAAYARVSIGDNVYYLTDTRQAIECFEFHWSPSTSKWIVNNKEKRVVDEGSNTVGGSQFGFETC